MKTKNKYTGRILLLTALLLSSLVTGCSSSNNNDEPDPTVSVPTVTETSPTDTAIDVALGSKVTSTFSEAMDPTTIDTTSFTVIGAGETALVGSVSFNATTNTANFTPGGDLTPSTVYTATLTSNVNSSAGTALAANVVWSFTTGILPDTIAPTVSNTSPADAATGVVLTGNLTANFSEALDATTVNASTFTLSDGITSVPGAVSYSNQVATFNPTSDLTASTVYTATLTTAIADLAANPLAASGQLY